MASLLRTKRLLWGIIFGLVTVMAWLSCVSGRRYIRAERWIEHTLEVQATIDHVVSSLEDAEDANRGYLLTRNEDLLLDSVAARNAVPRHLAHLTELTHDNSSQQTRLL